MREWKEETGCDNRQSQWFTNGKILGDGCEIMVYTTRSFVPTMTKSATKEPISWHPIYNLPNNLVDNVADILLRCTSQNYWEIMY